MCYYANHEKETDLSDINPFRHNPISERNEQIRLETEKRKSQENFDHQEKPMIFLGFIGNN